MTTFVVRDARPGAKACDMFSHITPSQAKALRADGFELVFLYAELVTAADLDAAAQAGLAVGFVMEGLGVTTQPSAALGTRMAQTAIARLRGLAIPSGVTLFSDLEGEGRPTGAWIDYANAAADTTEGLGDIAGAYVGAGLGLTSQELYALRVHRYWKSGSQVLDRNGQHAEPSCGWCVVQGTPLDYAHAQSGLKIDLDVVWEDYAKRSITVAVAQEPVDVA